METKNNPLLCDPEEGFCGLPESTATQKTEIKVSEKPIKVIYFTDPICSSCWGIEPQLRKLKLEYGDLLDIEYRMGGLLPNWTYNSGGISKPSDVAHHWDEVSSYYDMPIDGDVWLEDPLDSSYPPSIAFKAAQIQDKEKAILFLREIREFVFLHKKNIAKWEIITLAAQNVGLDVQKLKTDIAGEAKTLFEDDLYFAKLNGVRGFPTMFFIDKKGQKEIVYGSKSYPFFQAAILNLKSDVTKVDYDKDIEELFSVFPTLTAREFAELSETPRPESEEILNDLVAKGTLERLDTKNGSIWKKVN